jgi:hypothetical protein
MSEWNERSYVDVNAHRLGYPQRFERTCRATVAITTHRLSTGLLAQELFGMLERFVLAM